jgi:hypothetical protein
MACVIVQLHSTLLAHLQLRCQHQYAGLLAWLYCKLELALVKLSLQQHVFLYVKRQHAWLFAIASMESQAGMAVCLEPTSAVLTLASGDTFDWL